MITTEIKINSTFYYAEERHQQYLHKNPNGYCNLKGTGLTLKSCTGKPADGRQPKVRSDPTVKYPIFLKNEIMCKKEHGTCSQGPMKNLKWNIRKVTDLT